MYIYFNLCLALIDVTAADRSNGFEKKLFQRQNEKKRRCAESYEWGVEDM